MPAADLRVPLASHGYAVWRSLLPPEAVAQLYRYAQARATSGTMAPHKADPTLSAAGDFIMDGLLAELAPRVEHAIGRALWPTYSYVRVYRRNDVLPKHTDRPACEVSLTLCLGFVAADPWPLWIEGPLGVCRVELEPGDALVYRGIECPHWRNPLHGESATQVFLHYVDRGGPHAEWKFDKRPSLTRFPLTKDVR